MIGIRVLRSVKKVVKKEFVNRVSGEENILRSYRTIFDLVLL
jgi:hypothetical protein